jgi:hypothetical protein
MEWSDRGLFLVYIFAPAYMAVSDLNGLGSYFLGDIGGPDRGMFSLKIDSQR